MEANYANGLAGLLSPLFPHDAVEVQRRRAKVLSRMISFGLDYAWIDGAWDEDAAQIVKRAAVAALSSEIRAARVAAGSAR